MAKEKKGTKLNPIKLGELEEMNKLLEEANKKPYVIVQAAIKDGVCNYTFEIVKGTGTGDCHSVKGNGIVLDDMYNAFTAFNVHMACIDDAFKIAGIEIENIDDFINHDLTFLYAVNGFKIKGSKDDESIILIGTKHVSTGGHIELQSPKIPLDGLSSYKWYNELKAVADNARMEVELYKEGKYEIAEEQEEKPQKFKQMTILEAGNDEDIDEVEGSGESGNSGENAAAFFVHDDFSKELNQGKL